jgi:hypothetical protein
MNTHTFFRKFNELERDEKFQAIELPLEVTSLFVIFKQLEQVRYQKKICEEKEEHLLNIAENRFNELEK